MRDSPFNVLAFLETRSATYTLMVMGVILRLIAMLPLVRSPLFSDARSYHLTAVRLANHESFVPYWPPSLPYYLLLIHRMTAPSEIVSRLSMIVLYAGFALMLFLLARRFATYRAANLVLLAYAVYPTFIYHSIVPMTELPAGLCLVAGVWLTLSAIPSRAWRYPILLGIVLGGFALLRASSIILIPAAGLVLLTAGRSSARAALTVVIAGAIVCAWLAKAQSLAGHFVMINTANTENFFFGNNPYTPLYKTWWFGSHGAGEPSVPQAYRELLKSITSLPEPERESAFRKAALDHIRSRPDLFALRTLNRICSYFVVDTYLGQILIKAHGVNTWLALAVMVVDASFFLLVMVLAALFLCTWTGPPSQRTDLLIILGAVVLYAFPYWISFSHPRLHFPVVPLMGVLAGAMLDRLLRERARDVFAPLRHSTARRWALAVSVALLACIQIEWVLVVYVWR